ncbi:MULTISPECIES: ricin-type beta-trefoil lectin domain protein [Alphaproteobacteria]|uniref:ricin-type beta-trefoil lectin domain protein n=1 Tax=Alphaproteobacteria TaxID=28211 RepID=UPI0032657F5A
MTKLNTTCSAAFAAAFAMIIPQVSFAEAPDIQTKGAVIHLADNLGEEAKLGWCIDTKGRGLGNQLHAHSCKPNGDDVLFSFSPETGAIESVTYKGKCMAHSDPENAKVPFGLIACDIADPRQKFSYDTVSMEMHLAADTSQCVTVAATIDDAGPYQSRDLILAACKGLDPSFKQWVIQN